MVNPCESVECTNINTFENCFKYENETYDNDSSARKYCEVNADASVSNLPNCTHHGLTAINRKCEQAVLTSPVGTDPRANCENLSDCEWVPKSGGNIFTDGECVGRGSTATGGVENWNSVDNKRYTVKDKENHGCSGELTAGRRGTSPFRKSGVCKGGTSCNHQRKKECIEDTSNSCKWEPNDEAYCGWNRKIYNNINYQDSNIFDAGGTTENIFTTYLNGPTVTGSVDKCKEIKNPSKDVCERQGCIWDILGDRHAAAADTNLDIDIIDYDVYTSGLCILPNKKNCQNIYCEYSGTSSSAPLDSHPDGLCKLSNNNVSCEPHTNKIKKDRTPGLIKFGTFEENVRVPSVSHDFESPASNAFTTKATQERVAGLDKMQNIKLRKRLNNELLDIYKENCEKGNKNRYDPNKVECIGTPQSMSTFQEHQECNGGGLSINTMPADYGIPNNNELFSRFTSPVSIDHDSKCILPDCSFISGNSASCGGEGCVYDATNDSCIASSCLAVPGSGVVNTDCVLVGGTCQIAPQSKENVCYPFKKLKYREGNNITDNITDTISTENYEINILKNNDCRKKYFDILNSLKTIIRDSVTTFPKNSGNADTFFSDIHNHLVNLGEDGGVNSALKKLFNSSAPVASSDTDVLSCHKEDECALNKVYNFSVAPTGAENGKLLLRQCAPHSTPDQCKNNNKCAWVSGGEFGICLPIDKEMAKVHINPLTSEMTESCCDISRPDTTDLPENLKKTYPLDTVDGADVAFYGTNSTIVSLDKKCYNSSTGELVNVTTKDDCDGTGGYWDDSGINTIKADQVMQVNCDTGNPLTVTVATAGTCVETATPSVTADAEACAAVTDLNDESACNGVLSAGTAACTYIPAVSPGQCFSSATGLTIGACGDNSSEGDCTASMDNCEWKQLIKLDGIQSGNTCTGAQSLIRNPQNFSSDLQCSFVSDDLINVVTVDDTDSKILTFKLYDFNALKPGDIIGEYNNGTLLQYNLINEIVINERVNDSVGLTKVTLAKNAVTNTNNIKKENVTCDRQSCSECAGKTEFCEVTATDHSSGGFCDNQIEIKCDPFSNSDAVKANICKIEGNEQLEGCVDDPKAGWLYNSSYNTDERISHKEEIKKGIFKINELFNHPIRGTNTNQDEEYLNALAKYLTNFVEYDGNTTIQCERNGQCSPECDGLSSCSTTQAACVETATTSVAADAAACTAVTDLNEEDACVAVQKEDSTDDLSPACTYTPTSCSCTSVSSVNEKLTCIYDPYFNIYRNYNHEEEYLDFKDGNAGGGAYCELNGSTCQPTSRNPTPDMCDGVDTDNCGTSGTEGIGGIGPVSGQCINTDICSGIDNSTTCNNENACTFSDDVCKRNTSLSDCATVNNEGDCNANPYCSWIDEKTPFISQYLLENITGISENDILVNATTERSENHHKIRKIIHKPGKAIVTIKYDNSGNGRDSLSYGSFNKLCIGENECYDITLIDGKEPTEFVDSVNPRYTIDDTIEIEIDNVEPGCFDNWEGEGRGSDDMRGGIDGDGYCNYYGKYKNEWDNNAVLIKDVNNNLISGDYEVENKRLKNIEAEIFFENDISGLYKEGDIISIDDEDDNPITSEAIKINGESYSIVEDVNYKNNSITVNNIERKGVYFKGRSNFETPDETNTKCRDISSSNRVETVTGDYCVPQNPVTEQAFRDDTSFGNLLHQTNKSCNDEHANYSIPLKISKCGVGEYEINNLIGDGSILQSATGNEYNITIRDSSDIDITENSLKHWTIYYLTSTDSFDENFSENSATITKNDKMASSQVNITIEGETEDIIPLRIEPTENSPSSKKLTITSFYKKYDRLQTIFPNAEQINDTAVPKIICDINNGNFYKKLQKTSEVDGTSIQEYINVAERCEREYDTTNFVRKLYEYDKHTNVCKTSSETGDSTVCETRAAAGNSQISDLCRFSSDGTVATTLATVGIETIDKCIGKDKSQCDEICEWYDDLMDEDKGNLYSFECAAATDAPDYNCEAADNSDTCEYIDKGPPAKLKGCQFTCTYDSGRAENMGYMLSASSNPPNTINEVSESNFTLGTICSNTANPGTISASCAGGEMLFKGCTHNLKCEGNTGITNTILLDIKTLCDTEHSTVEEKLACYRDHIPPHFISVDDILDIDLINDVGNYNCPSHKVLKSGAQDLTWLSVTPKNELDVSCCENNASLCPVEFVCPEGKTIRYEKKANDEITPVEGSTEEECCHIQEVEIITLTFSDDYEEHVGTGIKEEEFRAKFSTDVLTIIENAQTGPDALNLDFSITKDNIKILTIKKGSIKVNFMVEKNNEQKTLSRFQLEKLFPLGIQFPQLSITTTTDPSIGTYDRYSGYIGGAYGYFEGLGFGITPVGLLGTIVGIFIFILLITIMK